MVEKFHENPSCSICSIGIEIHRLIQSVDVQNCHVKISRGSRVPLGLGFGRIRNLHVYRNYPQVSGKLCDSV